MPDRQCPHCREVGFIRSETVLSKGQVSVSMYCGACDRSWWEGPAGVTNATSRQTRWRRVPGTRDEDRIEEQEARISEILHRAQHHREQADQSIDRGQRHLDRAHQLMDRSARPIAKGPLPPAPKR